MIQFKTGRTYDAEQVLEITIEQDEEDEFGIREITATFVGLFHAPKDETIAQAVDDFIRAYEC